MFYSPTLEIYEGGVVSAKDPGESRFATQREAGRSRSRLPESDL